MAPDAGITERRVSVSWSTNAGRSITGGKNITGGKRAIDIPHNLRRTAITTVEGHRTTRGKLIAVITLGG